MYIKKELFLIYGEIVICIGNKCTPGKGVHEKGTIIHRGIVYTWKGCTYIKKELFHIHGGIVTCINMLTWKGCTSYRNYSLYMEELLPV